jgi:competence/damage-inducible protein CinA-like protein
MPNAEILTIGTELLLGETVDTNSRYIARALRDMGVDVYWTSTVGDNQERIAEAIQQGIKRSDIIITTGGMGPTIDDPTRNAVALAVGVETEFQPELWEQIKARFRRFGHEPTENNMRQAYIPKGSIPIENPVGTAPCFIVKTEHNAIISLPGVPREMETLMQKEILPYLRRRFDLRGLIKTRVLHTAGVGESQIDNLIGDLEELSNPTVGLAAHAGAVDIRITAKAESETEADALIKKLEFDLRERLGDWIFGVDQDTLERAAVDNLSKKGWRLVVVEAGLSGGLTHRLVDVGGSFLGGEVLTTLPGKDDMYASCQNYRMNHHAEVCLGVVLHPGKERQELLLTIITPVKETFLSRSYGGPPQMAPGWAINLCLNLIRRLKASV